MEVKIKVLLCLTLVSLVCCTPDKRLVLHSSEDISHLISTLGSKVNALEAEVSGLKVIKSNCGGTFIRWGRTTCPSNGTEFIYKGYMAGDKWNEYGGGANNLCLLEDPTFNQYVDVYDGGATIYGSEIELGGTVSSTLFGKQTYNQDIPCAVCRSARASHIMLPARANCYPGWTEEYGGFLIASNQGWKASSDYVCLDSGLEFVPHGSGMIMTTFLCRLKYDAEHLELFLVPHLLMVVNWLVLFVQNKLNKI